MQSLGNCLFTCLFTVQADLLHIYGTRPRSGPPAYTFSNINTSSPRLRCPCTRPDCPHRKYNTGFRIEPKRKWPYTHCEVLGVFKGIVHSKMKIFWKVCSLSGHSRCRWVCYFIGRDLDKFRITSLAHQWIICSEWVPSEWESKQLIKTSQ